MPVPPDEYVRTPDACARAFEDAFRYPDAGAVIAATQPRLELRGVRRNE